MLYHLYCASTTRRARLRVIAFAGFALIAFCGKSLADVRVCTYNLLFYDSGEYAARDPHLQVILSAINPDVLCVQEISSASTVMHLRDVVLNGAGGPGVGNPYSMATFQSDSNINVALLYRPGKFTEISGSFLMIPTASSPRAIRRWRLRPVNDGSGANDLWIYGMHLAASDAPLRAAEAANARTNANNLPANSHILFMGDFNIDSTNEGAYQRFTESQTDNDGRAWDALNPNLLTQTWTNNAAFSLFHTQSPHNNNSGASPQAIGGGMDDRFDFILMSSGLHDGFGQDYISGSYRAFGNDGQHFNDDINDPPTIPEGATIANALHAASDHLPVVLNLSEAVNPPQIAAPGFFGFPQVVVGATVTADITISNPAPAPGGPLQYSFGAPAGFSVPGGMFQLNPGASAMHTLELTDTATSGTKIGTLVISNNTTTNPKNVTLVGSVLDHAVPSTAPDAIETQALLDFGDVNPGEAVEETVFVYNAMVPEFPDPVNLSIDAGMITGAAADRFSFVGFSPPIAGIAESAGVTIRFDAAGAALGMYSAIAVFETSDDTVAPGGSVLADISFQLQANVPAGGPLRGDFDLNLNVGLEDVEPFVTVLLAPDVASPEDQFIADMTENGVVDAEDLQLFVDAVLN